ncbi:hypothetical protein QBC35DRAFT_150060 [Podospora australis]|uniref:Ring-like domain-containing protein n=1 Tax=Podospora australis TaxID=1536484 RepID=A0AAN6WW78_9PEZI|nr:hypothetical protein QBC35DRAFT_150060 [Podospora australis]
MAPHLPWLSKGKLKTQKQSAPITTPSEDGVSPLTSNEDLTKSSAGKANAKKPPPGTPLLNDDDERFLERLLSHDVDVQLEEEGPRPPLPPRTKTPDLVWDSETESFHLFDTLAPNPNDRALVLANQNTKPDDPSSEPAPPSPSDAPKDAPELATKDKKSRLSRLFSRSKKPPSDSSPANLAVPGTEDKSEEKEWADLTRILDKLSLSTSSDPSSPSKVSALSSEAKDLLVKPFLQILKDLANGVPTAADDLVQLLDGRNDVLSKNFSKLPSSLQKLVTQLPKKLTSTLAPEILAAAAEAQGKTAAGGDVKSAAKSFLPRSLNDLVLTPALIKTMLKAIVNALKTRFPAFMGTAVGVNMLWSLAVFLLLFVLWYCHKRGKEEREKREGEEGEGEGEVKAEEVVETVLQGARAEGEGQQGQGQEGSQQLVIVSPPEEITTGTGTGQVTETK